MDKCKPLNFGAGLGIGLGAGIFIGMLLAPKSGRKTRQVIRTSAVEGEEYLEQRGAALRDALKDLIHAVSRQRDNLTAAIEAANGRIARPAAKPRQYRRPLRLLCRSRKPEIQGFAGSDLTVR
jgi:gas vesicle protein